MGSFISNSLILQEILRNYKKQNKLLAWENIMLNRIELKQTWMKGIRKLKFQQLQWFYYIQRKEKRTGALKFEGLCFNKNVNLVWYDISSVCLKILGKPQFQEEMATNKSTVVGSWLLGNSVNACILGWDSQHYMHISRGINEIVQGCVILK